MGGVVTRGVVSVAVVAIQGLALVSCSQAGSAPEPARVVVQHLLVSFGGKVPGKIVKRTQAEAKTLARDLLARARTGEDFDALVKQYDDSQAPGRYTIVNRGGQPAAGEYGRDQLVPGFGDVSFGLQVGEIGLSGYDAVRSPFGYHLIRRIE